MKRQNLFSILAIVALVVVFFVFRRKEKKVKIVVQSPSTESSFTGQGEALTKLLEYKTQAHWLHLLTKSYAQHKSLQEFYEKIDELADRFIETYFGKYGRQEIISTSKTSILMKPEQLINDVYEHTFALEKIVDIKDTDLHNIIADIRELCNRTKYLLTLN
jgi:hypothetical protein